MADTARNKADLKTILPDNTSGAISPQDLRDVVESVQIHGATCWDDQQGDAENALKKDGLTKEQYRDTLADAYFYNHDAVNYLTHKFQFSHRFAGSAGVRVHAHLTPCATGAGNAVFEINHVWSRLGGYELPAASGWTTAVATIAITTADVFQPQILHLATAAVATGVGASSILYTVVKRLGTSSADTYTTAKTSGDTSANLMVEYIDVHYRVSRAGTEGEYS